MPKLNKKDPAGGRPRTGVHGVHANWVRTGGLIGDNDMQKMEAYLEQGAGVDESKLTRLGPDPNEDISL
jgi:hypothetical protein